ncbi:MAG: hypothetical protein IT196_23355, partial [Acidimicrobiales bacterium]|nr:hypothetical protein [Acidimicrobiales bacterium]
MSDLQDRRSMPEATGAETAPFVIGCTHDDRDWAEWVASHLDGLGYPYQFADPFLPTGPAAIGQVADWRASGVDLVVIASDALLHGVPIDLHLGHHTDRETPLIIVLIEDVELPAEWRDAIQARMFEVPDDYHASRDMLLRALEQARARPFVLDGSAEAVAAMAAARRDPLPAPMIVVDPFPAPEPVIALEAASHAANGATDHAVGEVPAPEPLKPAALSAPLPEALTTAPQVIDLSGEGPALLTPPPTTPAFGTFIGVPPAPPPVSPWGTAPNAPSAWSAPGEPALEHLPAFPPPAAPAPELGTEPDERPAAVDAPIIGSVPAPADAVEATEIEPPAEQAVAEPASPWASVEAAITAPPPAPAPPADVAAPPAAFASPVGVASSPWSAPVEVTPAAASAAAVDDPPAPTLDAPAAALAPDLPTGAVEPPSTAEAESAPAPIPAEVAEAE